MRGRLLGGSAWRRLAGYANPRTSHRGGSPPGTTRSRRAQPLASQHLGSPSSQARTPLDRRRADGAPSFSVASMSTVSRTSPPATNSVGAVSSQGTRSASALIPASGVCMGHNQEVVPRRGSVRSECAERLTRRSDPRWHRNLPSTQSSALVRSARELMGEPTGSVTRARGVHPAALVENSRNGASTPPFLP